MYYGTPDPIMTYHLPIDKGNYHEVFKIDVLAKLTFYKKKISSLCQISKFAKLIHQKNPNIVFYYILLAMKTKSHIKIR